MSVLCSGSSTETVSGPFGADVATAEKMFDKAHSIKRAPISATVTEPQAGSRRIIAVYAKALLNKAKVHSLFGYLHMQFVTCTLKELWDPAHEHVLLHADPRDGAAVGVLFSHNVEVEDERRWRIDSVGEYETWQTVSMNKFTHNTTSLGEGVMAVVIHLWVRFMCVVRNQSAITNNHARIQENQSMEFLGHFDFAKSARTYSLQPTVDAFNNVCPAAHSPVAYASPALSAHVYRANSTVHRGVAAGGAGSLVLMAFYRPSGRWSPDKISSFMMPLIAPVPVAVVTAYKAMMTAVHIKHTTHKRTHIQPNTSDR